ncbi:MAG TPA: hypothetical protein EYM33_03850 [Pseudomonadales bacterium]|nr:hypothetical protein [Pseudomonadales bacterium]
MKTSLPPLIFRVFFVVLVIGTTVSFVSGDAIKGTIASLLTVIILVVIELVQFSRWTRNPLSPPRMFTGLLYVPANRLFMKVKNARDRSKNLVNASKTLRTQLKELPEAWIVIKNNGNIAGSNDAAGDILDLPIKASGINLIEHWQDPRVETIIRSPVTDEIIEVSSPKEVNTQLEVRTHLFDDDHRLILVRDVTPLNRLLTTRQDFLANISHELRSPLTVIVGYLEALQDSATIQDTEEIVARLFSPVQRMRNLVEDLLTLTRLESSPRPSIYEMDNVNVAKIIETISGEIKGLESFNHVIEMSIDDGAIAVGIQEEIYSAINNLIINAVRYTPGGEKITIRWLTVEGGYLFEVSDSGPGIAPEHLQHLTERFYRVDSPRNTKNGGTGLGLAIVKHILLRHESTLTITSTIGEGSTFGFKLPQARRSI